MTKNELEIIVSQEDRKFTVYNNEPNYYEPSEDRKIKFLLDGDSKPTYWNYHDYQLLMAPKYEERKERELETRCLIPGKNGRLVRCMKNCSLCDHSRTNHNVSLDLLSELGHDFASGSESVMKKLLDEELMKKYFTVLNDFDERDKAIIVKHIAGKKPTQIAREIGISQQTVSYRIPILMEQLKELLEDYF